MTARRALNLPEGEAGSPLHSLWRLHELLPTHRRFKQEGRCQERRRQPTSPRMQSPSLPEPMLRCAASTSSDQVRPLVPPPVLVPDDDEATTYTATYRTLQRFDALDKLFKPKAPTTTKGCKPRWPSIFNKVKGTVEGAVEAVISPTTLIYSSLADAVFLNADAGCPRLGSASRRSPASKMRLACASPVRKTGMAARTRSYLNSKKTSPVISPKKRWQLGAFGVRKGRFALAAAAAVAREEAAAAAAAATKEEEKPLSSGSSGEARRQFCEPDASDALDDFINATSGRTSVAPLRLAQSDVSTLCQLKRREVLLAMGVEPTALPPSLRGYAAIKGSERRKLDSDFHATQRESAPPSFLKSADTLDSFMASAVCA